MFKRVDKFLVITTNNLRALEAISYWIYRMIGGVSYFIEVEVFPNMTLYRICIACHTDMDKKTKRMITKDLEARHITLMEEL